MHPGHRAGGGGYTGLASADLREAGRRSGVGLQCSIGGIGLALAAWPPAVIASSAGLQLPGAHDQAERFRSTS